MSESSGTELSAPNDGRRPRAITVLVALLLLEAAGLAVITIYLVIETLTAPATSVFSAIFLAILAAIAAIWLVVIALNVLRGNAWVRGASIVIQVLLLAIAANSFIGQGANALIGVVLLVPAVLVLVLLFTKSVLAATARRDR